MVPVHYVAVLLAAIASMPLGFLWYGPLFGKERMKLIGMSEARMKSASAKGMTKEYIMMFVGSLIMAFVLAHALIFANTYLHTNGLFGGIMTGFMNWLGFIAPVTLGVVLWEGKPWKLWIINNGYYLVLLVVMGIILSVA